MDEQTATIETATIETDAGTAVVETPVVTEPETVATEVVADDAEIPADETASDAAETGDEESGEQTETDETQDGEGDAEGNEAAAESAPEYEPIVFADTDSVEDIAAKVETLAERWELPEEVTAAISALTAKANANTIAEFADYGDRDQIVRSLDTYNQLYSSRIEDGNARPNTDKVIESIPAEKRDWLLYDLTRMESAKYAGRTKWEEINIDALSREGESPDSAVRRFDAWKKAIMDGDEIPASDIPKFIPEHLHGAFRELDRDSRQAIADLDPEYFDDHAPLVAAKVRELELIEKGRQADIAERKAAQEAQRIESERLVAEVSETQTKFYDTTRTQFAERLVKESGLSALEAAQRVALVETAFLDDSAGKFARDALKAEGIKFDATKAKALTAQLESASVQLVDAKRFTDASGKPLDPVQVARAQRAVTEAAEAWQKFADDMIRQQNTVGSEQKELREQAKAAKKKIVPKARAVPSTAPVANVRKPQPPAFGSAEYDEYWADQILKEQAERASAYR